MTKEELTEALLLKTGIPRDKMDWMYSAFAGWILRKLFRGQQVKLGNFGTFYARKRAARRFYNRHTDTFFLSHTRTIAKFRPHQRLRDFIGS